LTRGREQRQDQEQEQHLGDGEAGHAHALATRLRHARGAAALAEGAVHDLARKLDLRDGARLIGIVTLLAGVRSLTPQTLARRLGEVESMLSSLRFQRLMRAEGKELAIGLRRAVILADRQCNVAALGANLIFWSDRVRKTWCFHYFGAAAPQDDRTEVPV